MRALMLLAALAPAFVLLFYFWERDDLRTPAENVWSGFMVGAVSAFPVVAVVGYLIAPLMPEPEPFRRSLELAFLAAAIPEESAKLMVVGLIFYRQHDLARPYDILMLAVSVSIGFAALENMFYLVDSPQWSVIAALRSVTAVPGHAFTGAVMGCFLAWRRYGGGGVWLWIGALLAPVLLHGTYNFFALLQGTTVSTGDDHDHGLAGIAYVGFGLTAIFEGLLAIYCSRMVLLRLPGSGANAAWQRQPSMVGRWIGCRRIRFAIWAILSLLLMLGGFAFIYVVVASDEHAWLAASWNQAAVAATIRNFVIGVAVLALFHGVAFALHAWKITNNTARVDD